MESSEKPPIKEVLEHYGADYVPDDDRWRPMKCPFHEDRSASASVYTGKQLFRCHACDIGGDSFDVIERQEGTHDWGSTVARAEELFGSSYQGVSPATQRGRRRYRVLDEQAREPVRGQRSILPARRRPKPLTGP